MLNALRHQRYVQKIDPFCRFLLSGVLNALRHQRYVQTISAEEIASQYSCSTPYGIKGMSRKICTCKISLILGAQRLTASKVCPEHFRLSVATNFWVLNALRHQRYVQEKLDTGELLVHACSTPYGIKGMSSLVRRVGPINFWACSTPYGIKGMSRLTRSISVQQQTVLNALRHQRYVQGATSSNPLAGSARAQRLTASKVCPAASRFPGLSQSQSAQRLTASKVCPVWGWLCE